MTRKSARRRLSIARYPVILEALRVITSLSMPILSLIGRASPLFYLCAVVLVASLLLGGGTRGGFLSDAILQLLAIPLLLVALWKMFEVPLTRQMKLALCFCLAIAVLPLIQLIPLPPWLWTALPNRQPSAETFAILGQPVPWMPISVSPQATWLSAISIVPPLAIFVATLLLTYGERRWLSLVIIAVGTVSVFVGLIQVAQGEQSPFRFFAITNASEAVGFFANRNHFAAFLYCLVVFTIAWTVESATTIARSRNHDNVQILASIGTFTVLVILLAAEVMTRSRTGLALTMVALLGSFALAFSKRREGFAIAPNNKLLFGAIALAVIFSLQFAMYRFLERASDLTQEDRPTFARTTIEAAIANMPIGSGLGTFVPVYAMFEKPEGSSIAYVNHAHNDILEMSLETGVLGLVLMGLFAAWVARRSVEIWRSAPAAGANALDWSIARAGTIAAALVALHSFLDYPLRTGAMMAIMAFACALMIEPPTRAECENVEVETVKAQRRSTRRLVSADLPTLPSSIPDPSSRALDVPSLPPEQRWVTDIPWPEDWSTPSERLSGGKNGSPSSSKPPKR